MNIGRSWVVLDTNVWIFGLRRQPEKPFCAHLLRCLRRLQVGMPRQVLRELQANLTSDEMHDLFRLFRHDPDRVDIWWDRAAPDLLHKYREMGCKLGDAAVASQVEVMPVEALISENRDFLVELRELPFRILSAEDALRELGEIE